MIEEKTLSLKDQLNEFLNLNEDWVPSDKDKIMKDKILYGISFMKVDENGNLKHIPYEEGVKMATDNE